MPSQQNLGGGRPNNVTFYTNQGLTLPPPDASGTGNINLGPFECENLTWVSLVLGNQVNPIVGNWRFNFISQLESNLLTLNATHTMGNGVGIIWFGQTNTGNGTAISTIRSRTQVTSSNPLYPNMIEGASNPPTQFEERYVFPLGEAFYINVGTDNALGEGGTLQIGIYGGVN